MIRIKKISKHVVTPIDVPTVDPDKIKGYDLIPDLYCAIFLCAKKKSGKTNAIFKILKECTGKKTHLYIVSSTIYNDNNGPKIVEYFEKKGIQVTVSTSLDEANIPQKVEELTQLAKEEEEERKKNNDEKPKPKLKLSFGNEEEEKKERKPKKIAPEYIFVFDDMSTELRDKSIATLIKKHRHFKSKIICSSQYVNDLAKDARKNIDIWILFGGHSIDKLEEVYKNGEFHIPFDLFVALYNNATKDKYNFFYADSTRGEFRKNFNQEYEIM